MYMYTNIVHHVVFSAGSMAHANFAVKFSLGIRETQGPMTSQKHVIKLICPSKALQKPNLLMITVYNFISRGCDFLNILFGMKFDRFKRLIMNERN